MYFYKSLVIVLKLKIKQGTESLIFLYSIKGTTKAMYLFILISVAKFYSKKYLDLKDTKEIKI